MDGYIQNIITQDVDNVHVKALTLTLVLTN